jgi:hypothetical protein
MHALGDPGGKTMRTVLCLLVLAGTLGGSKLALAQKSAGEVAADAALDANIQCFKDSVPLFDDKISPANVISAAVGIYCWSGRDPRKAIEMLGTLNTTAIKMGTQQTRVVEHWADFALPFVLQHRVSQFK